MKLITVPKFEHTLLAPKGFKFDISKRYIIDTVFGHRNGIQFINGATCLRWTENNINTHKDLGPEFFKQYLGTCLVEIDNTNHYIWLDENLEEFWQNVFSESLNETSCAGIIAAHGDKCYQYRDAWLEAGIPFFYGVALYLLTHTSEFGDTPKSESCQWVIDNYEKYIKKLPVILDSGRVSSLSEID